jgi:hypothetical protein
MPSTTLVVRAGRAIFTTEGFFLPVTGIVAGVIMGLRPDLAAMKIDTTSALSVILSRLRGDRDTTWKKLTALV